MFRNLDDIFSYVAMHIKWIDDKDSHGRNDYWQSPKETQEKDLATVKIFAYL